jgi:RNA polymerase sigma factor (sigma-70 family)
MDENVAFTNLIRRVRAGDAAAIENLWHQYEPLLRREIRLRLRDPRLRRIFDERDVCQSVMASFFVRVTAGQYDLEGPEQLWHLLARMGRNKLATQVRRQQALRRDFRRVEQLPEEDGPLDDGTSPSQAVAWRELLQQFRERLQGDERQLADLRAQGRSWADIAALRGGSADAHRVQLNRAVARVSRELGLDTADDE